MSVAVSRPRENRSDKGFKVNEKMMIKSGKAGTQPRAARGGADVR